MKLDILAIGVHPDDVELGCGGTVIKHIQLGKKVGILDLTLGELGTRGNATLRTQEAMASAQLMGLAVRAQIDLGDGFFEHNKASIIEISKILRHYQPDIVLANALSDRHPDHGRAAKLISDACFFSGLVKIETTFQGIKQAKWRPKVVYHYIQDRHRHPDFVIDVTEQWDSKIQAIKAFSSQFFDPNSKEPKTPISSQEFLDFLEARAREMGRQIGVKYGEGFNTARAVGVHQLSDIF